MTNPMSYDGKHAVVTGAYSGVGAALVELLSDLGAASITALDIQEPSGPVTTYVECDMGDPAAVDRAARAIGPDVDVLFNNAGIAATFPAEQVMRVNVFGLRRLTQALERRISPRGAIVNTASIAGQNWPAHLTEILELLAISDWDESTAWVDAHPDLVGDGYFFSKECIQVFTMLRAKELIARNVRIAAACPAPIDTPLLPKFKETMGDAVIDWTVKQGTGAYVTPAEVAHLLAYLGSDAAAYVSGVNVNIDAGFQASMITGQVDFSELAGV